MTRGALEGKGPQRRLQNRPGRRLEEVAKAFWGGYCRLQMPWKRALAIRETPAGPLEPPPPPSNASLPLASLVVPPTIVSTLGDPKPPAPVSRFLHQG